jgi:hypothetical protein
MIAIIDLRHGKFAQRAQGIERVGYDARHPTPRG